MLLSLSCLTNAVDKHQLYVKSQKEGFSNESAVAGMNASFITFILTIAIIFFILEVLLLFYSLYIAINCTKGGPERIVHVTLAIFFTFPYILLNVVFNKCAKSTLRGEKQH